LHGALAEVLAEGEGGGDQQQPADDGDDPVTGRPAGYPLGYRRPGRAPAPVPLRRAGVAKFGEGPPGAWKQS
jgi:hypothetical protein